METVISAAQEGSSVVRFKTSAGYSRTVSGKFVGYGPKGVVTKQGISYAVFGANGIKVDYFPESKWPEKQWQYSDYCR